MLVKTSSVGTTPGNLQIQHFSRLQHRAHFREKTGEDSTLARHRIYTANCYHLLNFEHLATQMQNKVRHSLCACLILDPRLHPFAMVFLCK